MTTLQEWSETMREQVAAIARSDPQAPLWHFIAPQGRCCPFDPNGALFWQGRHHLFYIFQNQALPHGGHCWGHASSSDLLNWTHHPTGLAPAPGDCEKGIFSGNAFVSKEGVPTLAYYGIDAGICLAQSTDDDLNVWTKLPENPVIPKPKEGEPGWGVYNVFDPHVWLEGEIYYAILGGKVKPGDIRDTVYLFRSDDMRNWRYVRPFYQPNPDWTGEEEDCACPDFFRIGDRHALLCISHPRGARCYLGRYENERFVPEEHHRMTWPGGSCFAPESLRDDRGRRVFWAWTPDQRQGQGGITNELGVMTMPRVLSLDRAGRLLIDPARELEGLRRNPRRLEGVTVADGREIVLQDISGDAIELDIRAAARAGAVFGVKLRASEQEETVIAVDGRRATLSIDTSRTSAAGDMFRRYPICGGASQDDVSVQTAPFALDADEPLRLRVFLDRSMLEVYANSRQCVTQRIYPGRADSLGVVLFSRGGATAVHTLEAWDMAATNLG